MVNNDLVYLNRRASEERVAALNCRHRGVRDIHLELAQAYEFRVHLLNEMTAIQTSPSHLSIDEDLRNRERSIPVHPVSVDSPQKTFTI